MQVVSIISTKGGVGKTTTAANLGGFIADAGLRVLLLDLDVQPTLSSYFMLGRARARRHLRDAGLQRAAHRATGVAHRDRGPGPGALQRRPRRTEHAAAARAGRAPATAPFASRLPPALRLAADRHPGRAQVLLEMAVLASDLALSPVTPEILAARELRRGTLQLIEDIAPYRHLGIEPPPLRLLINRVHPVSSNARLVQQALRQVFQEQAGVQVLAPTCRPSKPIRAPRREDCRCIGWSTASQWAESLPPRSPPCAILPASCSRSGRIDWPQCPAVRHSLLISGGPMANAHELARGHNRLRALIEFAVGEGWHVKRTAGGHLKFTKAGCAAIYTSSTASDHRAALNARAQIRRAERETRSQAQGGGHD
jgi:chromosome partitioning related protein ParA